jgi:hypothetical protein
MSIDAMKQALEVIEAAIEACVHEFFCPGGDWQIDGVCDPTEAIYSLREAIAEAEKQEPVAFVSGYTNGECVVMPTNPAVLFSVGTALYNAPVHAIDMSEKHVRVSDKWVEMQCQCGHKMYAKYTGREWVGLTNDEVNEFAAGCHLGNSVQGAIYKAAARLKEKNT